MVGVLGGFPAGYIVWFGSDSVLPAGTRAWLHGVTGWNWNGLVPAFSNLDHYPFWAGFGILFILGWICILAATLVTRPEPIETLQKFYVTAKPIGLWGPVRRSLNGSAGQAGNVGFGRDLLAAGLGIPFYFLLAVSLFSFMGGHQRLGFITLAASIVCGIFFARTAISRLKLSNENPVSSVEVIQ
jgi:hypothetical protein